VAAAPPHFFEAVSHEDRADFLAGKNAQSTQPPPRPG
jgi:hypothetical protein